MFEVTRKDDRNTVKLLQVCLVLDTANFKFEKDLVRHTSLNELSNSNEIDIISYSNRHAYRRGGHFIHDEATCALAGSVGV